MSEAAPLGTVLVIDDNAGVADALRLLFSLHEICTLSAPGPEEGLALLDRDDIDLVIQDMNFRADTTSGEEGARLYAAIRERHPDLPVVLLTAWTDLATAVALVKAGAADYLGKPWDDDKLLATVKNLLEKPPRWPSGDPDVACWPTTTSSTAEPSGRHLAAPQGGAGQRHGHVDS